MFATRSSAPLLSRGRCPYCRVQVDIHWRTPHPPLRARHPEKKDSGCRESPSQGCSSCLGATLGPADSACTQCVGPPPELACATVHGLWLNRLTHGRRSPARLPRAPQSASCLPSLHLIPRRCRIRRPTITCNRNTCRNWCAKEFWLHT